MSGRFNDAFVHGLTEGPRRASGRERTVLRRAALDWPCQPCLYHPVPQQSLILSPVRRSIRDAVVVERLTSPAALQVFQLAQANILSGILMIIGMLVEQLADLLETTRVKAVYRCPPSATLAENPERRSPPPSGGTGEAA